MPRRIFLPRKIILFLTKLARSAISRGKFSMPILSLAWFFVLGTLILFCSFFIGKISHAGYSLDLDYSCPANSGVFGRDYIFHKFKPKANAIQGFIAQKSGATQWYLCKGSLDTNNLLNNKNCENSTIVFEGIMEGENIGGNYYKFILPRSYTLEIGADYYFQTGGILSCFHYHNEHAVVACGIQADGSSPHCAYNNQNEFYGAGIKTIAAGAEPQPDPVILVPGIMGSWEVNGQWKLDPILHTYDNLWQAMKNAGYEEGKTLFAFPYEWRQDNTLTAYQLKQKIDEVKSVCNCNKVDIVAHSMGGLAARYYAESDYYGNDIDQLIFLGTPHRGVPEAYLRWEGATGFEGIRGIIAKKYFAWEAHARGYSSLFDYIQDYVKSTEQLLPDYAYLQNSGEAGFRIYDKNNYPNNYPYNIFLENINLADKLNKLADSGIKIMNFIGDTGDNTINAIKVSSGEPYWPMWMHGRSDDVIKLAGDNTVPEVSSSLFISTKIDNSDHNLLPTKSKRQIIEFLTGVMPTYEIPEIPEINKILVIGIESPVDFVIITQDGKRLGKDFVNNLPINEINSAFYSGFDTDIEFAVIPDPSDGEYRIELQGTGQGEYKLSASVIDDNHEIDKEFSGNIETGQERNFTIDYTAQAENPIGELEPEDTLPPVITINIPQPDQRYPRNQDLIVDYNVADDFSGVGTTTLTIDNEEISTTTIDLFDYAIGTHIITITAIDKKANESQAQVSFEIIANIESTIADIEEIHNRGWLKGGITKAILVNSFRLLGIKVKYFDKQIKEQQKLIEKIQNNPDLKPEQKQKLIEQYNKKIKILVKNRQKAINLNLDLIQRLLDIARKQNMINQTGYDIIINDINYLRENL